MRKFSTLSPALAIALAAATITAVPASASDERVSIVVPMHDLNLTTAAGQRTLASRINRAGRQICETGFRDVRAQAREAACMADIRAQAEAQLPGTTTIALTDRRTRG